MPAGRRDTDIRDTGWGMRYCAGGIELILIEWTMISEPIHLLITSTTALDYQGDHCTCIWVFGTPRFLAAKCQIQIVSPVLNVETREFQPKIENYERRFFGEIDPFSGADGNNCSWFAKTREEASSRSPTRTPSLWIAALSRIATASLLSRHFTHRTR